MQGPLPILLHWQASPTLTHTGRPVPSPADHLIHAPAHQPPRAACRPTHHPRIGAARSPAASLTTTGPSHALLAIRNTLLGRSSPSTGHVGCHPSPCTSRCPPSQPRPSALLPASLARRPSRLLTRRLAHAPAAPRRPTPNRVLPYARPASPAAHDTPPHARHHTPWPAGLRSRPTWMRPNPSSISTQLWGTHTVCLQVRGLDTTNLPSPDAGTTTLDPHARSTLPSHMQAQRTPQPPHPTDPGRWSNSPR